MEEKISDYLKRETQRQLTVMLEYLADKEHSDQEKYETLCDCLRNLKLIRRRIENETLARRYVAMRFGALNAACLAEMRDDVVELRENLFDIINQKTTDRQWFQNEEYPFENACVKALRGITETGHKLENIVTVKEQAERREYLASLTPALPFAN